MTIHYKKQCLIVQNVECYVPTETRWFDTQPRLRLYGWCEHIEINNDKAIIK